MEKYVVASTLIKDKKNGVINILTDIRQIEAISQEEAIGKYILETSTQFPEYYIHVRPVPFLLRDDQC